MNLHEFIEKYVGKKVDWDGAYGGQCVDLFRQYVHDVLELSQPKGVVGAADFWSNYESDPILNQNFEKIPNTPDFIPEAGDVVLWTRRAGDGYGHVAIYIEGDINQFTSLDQNWPTLSKVTRTIHNYNNVYGVLRPKKHTESNGEPIVITDQTRIPQIENKEVQAIRSELNDLRQSVKSLREMAETDAETIAAQEISLSEASEKVLNLIKDLKTANERIKELETELKEANNTIKDLRFELEEAIDHAVVIPNGSNTPTTTTTVTNKPSIWELLLQFLKGGE